jgi:Domain of unknown function (DUF4214)/FG-GAP-like repeat/RTX calcium-binding nonapeptide repeat (4 copies)
MQINISDKLYAGTFSYYKDGSTRPPVHSDPYVFDLNGDGVDEVIFGGLETQPNTPTEFSPITVHIFGWKDGVFQNLSSQWLPNGAGDINGVGSYEFADFNGDGLTDIFLSAYADMQYSFSPYVLINKGGFFEKRALPIIEAWQHGSSTFDINLDGYADVFATGYGNAPTIYLGGPNGLTPRPFTNGGFPGGSDVALGDFFGNGTISAIVIDSYSASNDTILFKIHLDNGSNTAYLEEFGSLPIPLLENPNTNNEESHDVRILALDFNADGYLDVVIFSRLNFDGTKWPNTSAVQLLQNTGSGVFVDVTATKLKGYLSESSIPYAPLTRDFNKDGLIDFYIDGPEGLSHSSASLLLQESSGKFVDTGRALLSSQVPNNGASTLAIGPDGNYHLITREFKNGQGIVNSQTIEFPDRDFPETLIGTKLSDHIWGMGGNDILQGLGGNDTIDGGTDTAIYSGAHTGYTVAITSGGVLLTDKTANRDGSDSLVNVERAKFTDGLLALDIAPGQNSGEVYRLYQAAFARTPDMPGVKYHLNDMETKGLPLWQIASNFLASPEFASQYGLNPSDTQYINALYKNVLNRIPAESEVAWYQNQFTTKAMDHQAALIGFSESPENVALVGSAIANGIWLG